MTLVQNDTGTRLDHYTTLLDMWQMGLEIASRYRQDNEDDKERVRKLEAAVELISNQIDRITGYEKGQLSDALFPLKRQIDAIPRDPEQIVGGRGTALNNTTNEATA